MEALNDAGVKETLISPSHRSGVRVQSRGRWPGSEYPATAAGFGCTHWKVSRDGESSESAVQRAAGADSHEHACSQGRPPRFRARAVRFKRSAHSPVHRDAVGFAESGHGDAGARPHAHLRAVSGLQSRAAALATVKAAARVWESPAASTRVSAHQKKALLVRQSYSDWVLSAGRKKRRIRKICITACVKENCHKPICTLLLCLFITFTTEDTC